MRSLSARKDLCTIRSRSAGHMAWPGTRGPSQDPRSQAGRHTPSRAGKFASRRRLCRCSRPGSSKCHSQMLCRMRWHLGRTGAHTPGKAPNRPCTGPYSALSQSMRPLGTHQRCRNIRCRRRCRIRSRCTMSRRCPCRCLRSKLARKLSHIWWCSHHVGNTDTQPHI